MTSFLQDLRYALRQLRNAPGFVMTAVLTLALGIGATTAIFTLVYQVMLRSIPVEHPEQLYKVGKEINCCTYGGLEYDWHIFSYDAYRQFKAHTLGIEGMAAVSAGQSTFTVARAGQSEAPAPLSVRFLSGNYFSLLGVKPFAGRLFQRMTTGTRLHRSQ